MYHIATIWRSTTLINKPWFINPGLTLIMETSWDTQLMGKKSRQCGCKTIKIGTVIFVEFGNGFFRSCIERNENDTLQKTRNKQIDECNIMQQGNQASYLFT